MAERKDRIRVQIDGKEFNVTGGSFQEMLAAVKQINGRRFMSDLKVWQLPGPAEKIQDQLEISGYWLEGGAPAAATPSPASQAPAEAGGDRIRIVAGGQRLAVVGGDFQEMLAAVKMLPGRRFNGETKMWEIPGDVGVIKGILEVAGFQLEGVEHISLGPVPAMESLDFLNEPGQPVPAMAEPDFSDEADLFGWDDAGTSGQNSLQVPESPPWWDDDSAPPSFEENEPLFEPEPTPVQAKAAQPRAATTAPAKRAGDRIRIRLGGIPLVVSGGSFQEMLTVIKNMPGRRFNGMEKVWEIPGEMSLESLRQTMQRAGFVVERDQG